MIPRIWLFVWMMVFSGTVPVFGQDLSPPSIATVPVAIDTTRLLSDQPLKSPWGAVLRSAVLPGWGQVYNKSYLKGAIAFSLNSFWSWRIVHYQRRWEDTGLQVNRDRRNDSYWFFGITYLLTLVDAYVDAYLFGFEDAMELTWRPPPDTPDGAMLTLRIRLR